MKAIVKRFSLVITIVLTVSTLFATTAFAATTYNPGTYYLGHFTFTNTNNGAMRIYKANKMRLKIAWKKVNLLVPIST